MDYDTIIFLLKDGHLNMEKRREKGIWPHPPLKFNDLVNVIVTYLKDNKWFPDEWEEPKSGELIGDSSAIEKVNERKFIYRSVRSAPIDLTRVGERTEKIFTTAATAAEYYLRNDLCLPGDLDGWKVI